MTIGPRTSKKSKNSESDSRIGCYHSTLDTHQLSSLRCSRSRNKVQPGCTRGEMSGHRRVSKLPSLKAPSPSTQNHLPTSPAPSSTGSDETSLKEPTSRLFKRQTRSRRTSVSSNENGSLTRDVHLSDFAFVEQLEDFRRQLLDLRKDKKKQEDEIIKYKLLCKEKHQNIQELHNKLEAEKANSYDLKDQLTRDITLQLQSQHVADKKKLTFDISILKNDKRKMESEIRLLETTNKGLFEEIRQIRSSYDAKMEKLMKDFHIEIYKESGEKRRLEKKLQDTNEKLTKEEYLAKQAELERDRAEEHARDARQRRTSTFGYETGTLDRQNKKIAELEETVRKLESLKTIAESQNLELLRKLKDAEKVVRGPVKKGIPKHDDSKDSPHTERKRNLNKVTSKEKIEAADKKLNLRDGKASKKDLENYLKLANKERNVLERKIALLEKTRQQTGDEKIDNEISALRQQHKELLKNISSKEKLLDDQDKDSDENEDKKSKIPAPNSNLSLPGKRQIPRSPRTSRRISRSPSPLMMMKLTEDGEEEEEGGKGKKKGDVGKRKQAGKRKDSPGSKDTPSRKDSPGSKDLPGAKKAAVPNGNVVTIDRSNYTSTEQQTVEVKTPQKDQEIQVEIYDEEDDGMYDLNNFDGGAGQFMFQEPEVVESAPQDIPLGAVHSNDKLMEELEEQMETLQKLREKDMQKIASLSEKLEQYKVEVASLNRKAGSYYSELEANTSKLNTSLAEIEKLNGEIKHLQNLNSTMDDDGSGDFGLQGNLEKELAEAKKDVEQLTADLREKQLTIMKLHQELHESSEELMDKSGMVRQLEALVDNLKHDKEIMREEQINYETTTEEVLDQLRTLKVRNNQLEELVKSLEADIETHKRDMGKLSDEKQLLQSEKERFEVETEDLSARMAARDLELETALSKNPTSEESQTTLNMLQEIRQKDNALKKLQKKHDETLMQVKKEVEKQVSHLQSKVSRRDDDLANLRADHNKERSQLMSQIGDLQSENTTLKDTVTSKDREIEEIYSSLASSEATVESKELNKRLAELANENMMLKDEINNYRDIVSDKRPKGFMGELGQRIQTQRPSYTGKVTPNVTISDQSGIEEEEEDEEDIGEIQVALVLYSYDPTHMSPNDYPEDELALTSGDFIYIFGDPDADGFFTAELMSGERGLVPSNFIQTVELNEKKTQQMRRMSQQRLSVAPVIGAPSSNSTNTDIPVPEEIHCEAIGTKTLELKWELPDTGAVIPILGFRIHVNSQEFKVTNTGECRTVLNELPPGRPLYISVQTLSVMGESRESKPCVYGREAIKAPQSLDVTNVTTNSAVLTFVGQAHYHHGVFVNGDHVITLQPGELLYMLRGLQPDTQYEIRIVTLSSDDTSLINKKTFSCSQSTTFLTEISGDWKPPSPPTSIDLAPSTPEDLQLNILDQDRIAVSWSAVEGAASYHIYLNSELERIVQPDQLKQILYLSELREQDDEQCFHVVALNSQGDRSLPSDTISFFKSELFSQLSYFFAAPEAGPSPPPSEPESEPGMPENLPEEIKSRLLVRISLPPESCDLSLGQVICVERDSECNYRTQVGDKIIHIPVTNVTNVPITRRVVALYDYHPSAMSPNPDCHNEISFLAGDVILVYGQDSEGFLKGVLDNKNGLVPSNFVIDLEAVLSLKNELDDSDQKENQSNHPHGLAQQIHSNLMTVNSS